MDFLSESAVEPKVVRRGFDEEDDKWFSEEALSRLSLAQEELQWMLGRGYKTEPVMNLIGGHYQLSARQRNALQRSTSSIEKCKKRVDKLLLSDCAKDGILNIDGFNLIITLEVALSGGTLILGNDGTIRDIAGLRGTYRIIDKTDVALDLMGINFKELEVEKVNFFLDAPVSNSGRLKERILLHSKSWCCSTQVELVPSADPILFDLGGVVTTDSVILDNCRSWYNTSREIIERQIKGAKIINLSGKPI